MKTFLYEIKYQLTYVDSNETTSVKTHQVTSTDDVNAAVAFGRIFNSDKYEVVVFSIERVS